MKLRPTAVLAVIALLAGCGGSEPTPPDTPTVTSVTVTPESPTVTVGETQQMSATARDENGSSVQGTVTWSSSNTSIATISGSGLVTAVAPGTSAVTATVSGVAGSQVVTVVADQCEEATAVNLQAGQYASYAASQCLELPSGAFGDYYRLAVVRPTQSEAASDVSDVTVEATALSTLQAAAVRTPAAAAAPAAPEPRRMEFEGLDGTRILENRKLKESTARFHMRMFEREIRERGPGPDGLARNRPLLSARLLADPPARVDLSSGFSCSASKDPHTLVNFNDNLAVYQDSAQRVSNPISQNATQEMLDYYDAYVKDMIPQYWGDLTDIDGNGRIIVTTSPTLGDSVAAAVFTGDLRTSGTCASGNLAEVIFFNVNLITEMDDPNPGWLALSTIGHEAKHLVSVYHRFAAGTGIPSLWIEEGTAEISAEMSSRIAWAATGGPAIGEKVTFDDLIGTLCPNPQVPSECDFTKEIYGVMDLIANTIVQISTHPNSLVTNPNGANEFHSVYASGWHYHRFLGDAYGNAMTPFAEGAFFKSLVDSTSALGFAAHQATTGRTFDELFEELVVAMSLHETGAPQPTREFTTWDLLSSTQIFAAPEVLSPPGIYPWPVTVSSDGNQLWAPFASNSFSTSVGPSGLSFFDFQSSGNGTDLQLEVTVDQPAKLIVSRIR